MNQDIKTYFQQLSPDSFATAADLFSESFPVEILSDSELEGVAGGVWTLPTLRLYGQLPTLLHPKTID